MNKHIMEILKLVLTGIVIGGLLGAGMFDEAGQAQMGRDAYCGHLCPSHK